MATIPGGLVTILQHAPLPPAALQAAADQRPLLEATSERDDLPALAVERAFQPGVPLPIHLAAALVDRPLPATTIRHILRTATEPRPEVLARLVRHNVPDAADRQRILAIGERSVDEAVLDNGRWPVDEQRLVVRRVGGTAALRWLSQLDPDVEVTWDDLRGDRIDVDRLDADPVTALRALLRRPWLAELPLERAGRGLRSALATVTPDERTQFRLLGTAQHLARFGRTVEAAGIIEALACNPSATLPVQRRCRRLARRIPCHYLSGWAPAHPATGAVWTAGPEGQRAALDRLGQLANVRHRTVWSAGLLASNPDLAEDVREGVIAYLDRHLAAVDADPRIADFLADRLEVDAETRQRWRSNGGADVNVRRRQRPHREGSAVAGDGWTRLHLDDCIDLRAAHRAARGLARDLGSRTETWTLAWILLREGWDEPLGDLPAVVAALEPGTEAAA